MDPHESQADAETEARRHARVEELARAFVRDLAALDAFAVEDGIGTALAQALDGRVIPARDGQQLDDLLAVVFQAQHSRRFLLGLGADTTTGPLDPRAVLWAPVLHLILVNLVGGTVPLAKAMQVLSGEEPPPPKPVLRVLKGGAT